MPLNLVKKLAIDLGSDEVDNMLARQNLSDMTAHTRAIESGAIGCLGGEPLPAKGNMLMFSGTPINVPDPALITDAQAAVRLLPECDGAFVAVFWDEQQQQLVVVTDCLGMQPLYMSRSTGMLRLVSETKAVRGVPDLAAWGAFISIGHPIGNRSLVEGLTRVPPARVLVYDVARQALTIDRYWDWPAPSDAWRHYDFLAALEAEIEAYARYDASGTLLLSGGFDSRLLLFVLERAGVPAEALIVAHDDEHEDADGRLAERLARLTATTYKKKTPPADFFSSSAYLDYLAASDIGFPSLDLFIAKVASQINSQAVWDGLAPGFLFMPLHQPEGGFEAYRRQEIRGADSAIWHAAAKLFKPEIVDAMHEGFADDLLAEFSALPQDGHGLARFVIENRSRNRAAMNPLKVYANRTMAFTPGLSKNFVSHAASIPFEAKQNAGFYYDLFSRLDSRALKVPFLSGGELLKPRGFNAAYYRERARLDLNRFRTRHPRLFAFSKRPDSGNRAPRSMFLDSRLLAADDPWLDRNMVRDLLNDPSAAYLAWKLLFHWKAWRAVHGQGLGRLFD